MKFYSHDSMPFPIVTQCEPQIPSAKMPPHESRMCQGVQYFYTLCFCLQATMTTFPN